MPNRTPARLRCAIYTRKSSEEGLEQDFNSLDAQREACEAFVASQKREGWTLVREMYDDGGFSGVSVTSDSSRWKAGRSIVAVSEHNWPFDAGFRINPKKRGPDQWARVMACAILVSDGKQGTRLIRSGIDVPNKHIGADLWLNQHYRICRRRAAVDV